MLAKRANRRRYITSKLEEYLISLLWYQSLLRVQQITDIKDLKLLKYDNFKFIVAGNHECMETDRMNSV